MTYDIALMIATYGFELYVITFVSIFGFWLVKRWIFD